MPTAAARGKMVGGWVCMVSLQGRVMLSCPPRSGQQPPAPAHTRQPPSIHLSPPPLQPTQVAQKVPQERRDKVDIRLHVLPAAGGASGAQSLPSSPATLVCACCACWRAPPASCSSAAVPAHHSSLLFSHNPKTQGKVHTTHPTYLPIRRPPDLQAWRSRWLLTPSSTTPTWWSSAAAEWALSRAP